MPPKQKIHLEISADIRKRLGKVPGETDEDKINTLLDRMKSSLSKLYIIWVIIK